MTRPHRMIAAPLVLLVCLGSPTIAAVWRQAQPAAQGPAEQAPSEASEPDEPEVYAYDPDGRRDPFVSLLNRGTDVRSLSERPAGLAGLSINEVSLRGIVFSQGRYVAVLEAPDNKTYFLAGDERLFDGSVMSISPDGVVFLEEVNDPLSLVKEREVRRTLGGAEEGR